MYGNGRGVQVMCDFSDFLFGCAGDNLKFKLRFACHYACGDSRGYASHSACVGDNYAFYVLEDIAADVYLYLVGKVSQYFPCFGGGKGDRNRFRATHSRYEFLFEQLRITAINRAVFIQEKSPRLLDSLMYLLYHKEAGMYTRKNDIPRDAVLISAEQMITVFL